jgi:hypothetical protein
MVSDLAVNKRATGPGIFAAFVAFSIGALLDSGALSGEGL